MVENISFNKAECSVDDDSISCRLGGPSLNEPAVTVDIDMSRGGGSVEVESGDIEFEANTLDEVALEGGNQTGELITDDGKVLRVFDNSEIRGGRRR